MALRKPKSALGTILTWLIFATTHFSLSQLILPATMALTEQSAGIPEGPGPAVALLVRLTQLLHLPLVTLALYPREWFPGAWVYVPMALDSLIWATAISGMIRLFKKSR
jgi:hypothetical protein